MAKQLISHMVCWKRCDIAATMIFCNSGLEFGNAFCACRRRVREPLFQLPEGFEPLNSTAYRKRFEHMLQPEALDKIQQHDAVIPAAEPALSSPGAA